MNELPIHPALVHVPLGIAVVLPVLSGALLIALWREWLPKRAWLLTLILSVVGFASAIAARQTGVTEEARVEEWVEGPPIHAHEEAADTFVVTFGVLTLACAGVCVIKRPRFFKLAVLVVTLGYGVLLGLGLNVGRLGGELVYKHGAASSRGARD